MWGSVGTVKRAIGGKNIEGEVRAEHGFAFGKIWINFLGKKYFSKQSAWEKKMPNYWQSITKCHVRKRRVSKRVKIKIG